MQCPSCGAPFDWHSKFAEVVTCTSCQGVSRVSGDVVTLAGQSAKLIHSRSGLGLGVVGSYENVAFTVVGRVRYGYARGFWDEWCAHTTEGTLIWLTEDDGVLSRTRALPIKVSDKDLDNLQVGRSIFLGDHDYLVEEIGQAKCLGTEGQLPFSALPGEEIEYISLRAGMTHSGTIERYDSEVHFYQGKHIKLDHLNLLNPLSTPTSGPTHGFEEAKPHPKQLGCFSCGGPVLPKEDHDFVTCHFCGTDNATNLPQVDCEACGTRFGIYGAKFMSQAQCPKCFQGIHIEIHGTGSDLSVFTKSADASPKQAALHQKGIKPFHLGQQCEFNGKTFVLTGHLRNEVVEDGESYYSDSFHLLAEDGEVKWLDSEENHYVLSERIGPLPERLLNLVPKTKTIYNGREYQAFDSGDSKICFVQGQFSYAARVDDKVSYYDFISPPYRLSAELSDQELEGFAGRYLPITDVARAFNVSVKQFREPENVAPSQPYIESELGSLVRTKLPFYILFFLLFMVLSLGAGNPATNGEFEYQQGAVAQETHSEVFEIEDVPTTLSLSLDTNVDNSWVYVDVALIDDADTIVHAAASTISYYHGYEGGESWSEGSSDHSFYFRILTPGSYRFHVQIEGNRNATIRYNSRADVWLTRFPLIGLVITALWWLMNLLKRVQFQNNRWRHLQDDDD